MDFKTPNAAAFLNIRFECAKKTIVQKGQKLQYPHKF